MERRSIVKSAIIYHSEHHGNTKKLLDAIAGLGGVVLIEASDSSEINLSDYDLIGFASGNYYSKLHDSVLQFAEKNLPQRKKTFVIYTFGVREPKTDAIKNIMDAKGARFLGIYGCPGFDTFGPLKLVGGVAKGRPNNDDIVGAVNFFIEISKK